MKSATDSNKVEFFGGELMSILPIMIYIGTAMILALKFNSLSMQSVTVGGIAGIFITFLFVKNKDSYWKAIVSGLMKPGNANLLMSFMLIGLFTTLLTKGHIGEGFVWISQELHLYGGSFVVFAFFASIIIAAGSGAPIAAIFAIVPLLYPPGIILGAQPAVLLGAIISGILCGDNLAPSSQVTLTAATSQTCKDTDKPVDTISVISSRAKYILIAAAVSAVLFYINGSGTAAVHGAAAIAKLSNPMGLLMLIPLAILLFVCIKTKNLFKGLSFGILTGIAVGCRI